MNECFAKGERVDNVDVVLIGQAYGGRRWCGEIQHVPRELDVTHRKQQPVYERESATTNSQRHHGVEHRLTGRAQHSNDCQ